MNTTNSNTIVKIYKETIHFKLPNLARNVEFPKQMTVEGYEYKVDMNGLVQHALIKLQRKVLMVLTTKNLSCD